MECWSGQRPVRIQGALQRTLLAVLLVSEGRPLPVDALAHELWGEHPPPKWENALQAHVSRLRGRMRAVADDDPAQLIALPSGYGLLVGEDAVDGTRFTRSLDHARALSAGDPAAAVAVLRAALALWRGPAFDLLAGGRLCRAAAHRYEAARAGGLELLFDLRLRVGEHADILPVLSELVESPLLNERFCEQLMIALYRSGRQTEALGAYRRMRGRLGDELGVEPTATLRNHEKAILEHDPALHVGADHGVLRI
jgi:DNA-binding SARP family transcriptional activator